MNIVWIFSYLTDSVFLWFFFRRSTYAANPQRKWLRVPLLLLSLPLYLNTSLLTIPYASVRVLLRLAVYFLWCWAAEGIPWRPAAYAALFWAAAYTLFQNLFFGPYFNGFFMGAVSLVPQRILNQLLMSLISVGLRLLFFGAIAKALPFSGFAGVALPHILLAAALCTTAAYIKSTGTPLLAAFSEAPAQFSGYYILMHLAILTVLIAFELVRRKTVESASLSVQNTEAKALLESIRDRQESEESIRALRHDLKNHVISMQLLLENGETEALAQYLESLRREAAVPAGSYRTGSELLDGLLKLKLAPAVEQGLRAEVNLDFSAGDFLTPFDLCVLMGNILDNALEACEKVESPEARYLRLSGGKTANCQLVRLENAAKGAAAATGSLPPTSKPDKNLHGFGLRNVKRVLERYGGTMTIAAEKDSFVLSMLIPIPEEP